MARRDTQQDDKTTKERRTPLVNDIDPDGMDSDSDSDSDELEAGADVDIDEADGTPGDNPPASQARKQH